MGIEKIGLPPKPAARGSAWVVDASSCQTCQNPFSFFNRKHHCRRCGGLFCANCTSSKVTLRGQGDGPVRVCEPCKTLEEAARFQLRNKGRQSKGILKGSSFAEDEDILKEVLDASTNQTSGQGDAGGRDNDQNHSGPEVAPEKKVTSPEKLREEAAESKKVYAALKQQGKNAEALQAYKRHKELGREADALELSLKKATISHRKSTVEGLTNAEDNRPKSDKEPNSILKEESSQRTTQGSQGLSKGRKSSKDLGDDDLLQSLKDLGWNEAELSEKKAKKGPSSDMDLLAEISDSLPNESGSKKPKKESPTQLEILAHKRRALALKRDGKPAEAKEELRKAKILEKKLEEMSLFEDEEDDDDDDELAALMRSLDKEAKTGRGKDSLPPSENDIALPFNLAEDDDATVEVTDDDIHDPSMIEALRSMGWVEEAEAMQRSRAPETGGAEAFQIAESVAEQSSLQSQILTIKRAALTLKREGKLAEAKAKLQEAKFLEQKLELSKSQSIVNNTVSSGRVNKGSNQTEAMRLEDILEDKDEKVEVDEGDMRDPEMMAALRAMGFEEDEEDEPPLQTLVQPSALERKKLQGEVLAIKRSALVLRKQGKSEEARDEVRRAQVLEQKLQTIQVELEKGGLPPAMIESKRVGRKGELLPNQIPLVGFISEDEEDEVGVAADDIMDPELIAALKSVGWQEEDAFKQDLEPADDAESGAVSDGSVGSSYTQETKLLSQKEQSRTQQIRRELLAHKRKALALKREGRVEEAKLELKRGRVLEQELEKIENVAVPSSENQKGNAVLGFYVSKSQSLPTHIGDDDDDDDEKVTDADMQDPEMLSALNSFGWTEPEHSIVSENAQQLDAASQSKKSALQKTVPRAEPKLDVTNPPYTKTRAESVPDPIWLSIMNSSIKNSQCEDSHRNGSGGKDSRDGENFDNGERGELVSALNTLPHHFDHETSRKESDAPSISVTKPAVDLLSGGAWEPDEDEDDHDVFDSSLMAALQGFGLGPLDGLSKPSKEQPSSGKAQKDGDMNMAVRREFKGGAERDGIVVPDKRVDRTGSSSVQPTQGTPGKVGNTSFPLDARGSASVHLDAIVNPRTPVPVSAPASSTSGSPESDLQTEIKMHKRKALALKREGKLNEARDELMQARVLETQLNKDSPENRKISSNVSKICDTASSTSFEVESQATFPKPEVAAPSLTHKEQMRQGVRQSKDRKKIQQESLAHKRKALTLRREGKTDEADAEFELAKVLEKQMEELDEGAKPGIQGGDAGLVENLFDPQLMAALKGLGWSDRELRGDPAIGLTASTSMSNSGRQETTSRDSTQHSRPAETRNVAGASSSGGNREQHPTRSAEGGENSNAPRKRQAERRQLEDRIKQEKLKALELKRAGRQAEAIEALKGAKKLEKQLDSIAS